MSIRRFLRVGGPDTSSRVISPPCAGSLPSNVSVVGPAAAVGGVASTGRPGARSGTVAVVGAFVVDGCDGVVGLPHADVKVRRTRHRPKRGIADMIDAFLRTIPSG